MKTYYQILTVLKARLQIFLVTIIFSSPFFAQDSTDITNIQWGEPEILPSKSRIPIIIGYDQTGYYALLEDYRWAIEHYDTELKHTKLEYVDLNDGLRTFELEALIHFHDTLYLFTSEIRFRSRKLYVQTVDKETLKQNSERKMLFDISDMGGWRADFHFALSKLEQKLLIACRTVIYGQRIEELHVAVFGHGMNPEWEADGRVEHDKKIYEQAEFVVDENGNAYMISLYYQPVLLQHLSPRKNSYAILAFTDRGKSVMKYFADFPDQYIRGIGIESAANGDLACAGFYSPSINDYSVDGLFFFSIDRITKNVKYRKFHEFESYFIDESMNPLNTDKLKYLYSFELKDLKLRKNGNFVITAEQVYEQSYDTYQNIIVAGLDSTGEILWERVIQKSQNHDERDYPNFSSYAFLAPPERNDVEIIFNDHLKNMNLQDEKKRINFHYNSRAFLSHYHIGEYGELGNDELYIKRKKRMLTPAPIYFYDTKTNIMIIPALRYRKYAFVKITF